MQYATAVPKRRSAERHKAVNIAGVMAEIFATQTGQLQYDGAPDGRIMGIGATPARDFFRVFAESRDAAVIQLRD